ncbi:hypothetical protein DFJ74DRAFT_132795 [Hyaloraphidium curvatum]|nr:hypothetical protein DFJ74DRAFT_132795 [Hyaloraphidium curvatum]
MTRAPGDRRASLPSPVPDNRTSDAAYGAWTDESVTCDRSGKGYADAYRALVGDSNGDKKVSYARSRAGSSPNLVLEWFVRRDALDPRFAGPQDDRRTKGPPDPIATPRETNLLFLCVVGGRDSYGWSLHPTLREVVTGNRTFADLWSLLVFHASETGLRNSSIALLVSDEAEHGTVLAHVEKELALLGDRGPESVLLARDVGLATGFSLASRRQRHDPAIQTLRRRHIAHLRNLLQHSALLPHHAALVWIDADVACVPRGALPIILAAEKDAVTMLSATFPQRDYDLNAWASGRQLHAWDLRKLHRTFAPVDSVGATFLFLSAALVRSGAPFPLRSLVGASWGSIEGDAIESEGVCLLARTANRTCWVMPWHASEHSHHGVTEAELRAREAEEAKPWLRKAREWLGV